jgi:hypothetical protein
MGKRVLCWVTPSGAPNARARDQALLLELMVGPGVGVRSWPSGSALGDSWRRALPLELTLGGWRLSGLALAACPTRPEQKVAAAAGRS